MLPKFAATCITIFGIAVGIPITIIGWTMLDETHTATVMASWTITYTLLILYAIIDTASLRRIPGWHRSIDEKVAFNQDFMSAKVNTSVAMNMDYMDV